MDQIAVSTVPSFVSKLNSLIEGLTSLLSFAVQKNLSGFYPHKLQFSIYTSDKKEFSRLARILTGGRGKIEKVYTDYAVTVKRDFSDMVTLSVVIDRGKVCERIVTGTKHHAAYLVEEHDEEIVEWKCK